MNSVNKLKNEREVKTGASLFANITNTVTDIENKKYNLIYNEKFSKKKCYWNSINNIYNLFVVSLLNSMVVNTGFKYVSRFIKQNANCTREQL